MGPYWLLGRLGSGGMGEVFIGRSPGGRLVAVKLVRAELAGQAEFRSRFARQVAAARTVSGVFRLAQHELEWSDRLSAACIGHREILAQLGTLWSGNRTNVA